MFNCLCEKVVMIKKIFLGLLFLGVALGGLAMIKAAQFKALSAQEPPVQEVSVSEAKVERLTWDRGFNAVGTLSPVEGALLEVELPGVVREVGFRSGEQVERGDVLVRLDTSVEEAELAAAEAAVELARVQFKRTEALVGSQALPQSNLDLARAELRQAEAARENILAVLVRKTIVAPFAGQAGIRQVNVGQYVAAGTPIVTLQNFVPIFVDFTLPQQRLSEVAVGQRIELRLDGNRGPLSLGELTAIDPSVDIRTRSIRLQGTLENEEGLLRPGMFGQVRVVQGERREVLAIPLTALVSAPYGDSVFIIKPKEGEEGDADGALIVEQKFVRSGERRGDFVEIVEGLEADDRVVASGAFKLRNNMRVRISQDAPPDAQESPTPGNS